MALLSCHDLDLDIGGKVVVEHLNLELQRGQFWGLMGANGIGKTTLMKCMAGLLEPRKGRVDLESVPLLSLARKTVAQQIGMLQQHTVHVFEASVLQTALTGRHPHLGRWQQESPSDRQVALDALAQVGMESLAERNVTTLSGGEARRLAFATLLVQAPQVLLLDEPSNHLDLKHQVRLMSRIGNEVYSEQRLAVAAMHDVNLAACYCSHILMLFGDGEWCAGPAAEMFNPLQLERLYQCPVQMIDTPAGKRFHPSFEEPNT